MKHFFSWMKEEIIRAIPAMIYFILSFNLINYTEELMLRGHGVDSGYVSYIAATIGAIFVVKILIIVDTFSFIHYFREPPLIYNIVWKFFIYNFAALIFRVGEGYAHLYWHLQSNEVALAHLKLRLHSPVFWAVELWLMMLLAVYIVFSECNHFVGQHRLWYLIFGKR